MCYYWKLSCCVALRQPVCHVGADPPCVGGYVGGRGSVCRRGNSPGGTNTRTLGFHMYRVWIWNRKGSLEITLLHSRICCGALQRKPQTVPMKVKTLSRVWLFGTPQTGARQAPLSRGFSRQEYWSGLPFPSPGDLPDPGIEPRSSALQADSSPYEPPGKPKNTGVGNLFLLQAIFWTPELNWGLLHCRWILYQLSCQGSPKPIVDWKKKKITQPESWELCFIWRTFRALKPGDSASQEALRDQQKR